MFQLLGNPSRKIALCQFTLEICKFLQQKFFRQGTIYLLSPPIVQNIFRTINQLTAYVETIFESRRIQTQRYGIESLTYLGPKISSQVPNEIKESAPLAIFRKKIKNWRSTLCPCKLCKTYVVNLGYLQRLAIN